MSALDPTEELHRILELGRQWKLPKHAVSWAQQALQTAESILATMADMADNDMDVPTTAQACALRNIYVAACHWLREEPE